MPKKSVVLTFSELCDELGLDRSNMGRGDIVRARVENPENKIPSFYINGIQLFRLSDVDAWAVREIQRQNAKANEAE